MPGFSAVTGILRGLNESANGVASNGSQVTASVSYAVSYFIKRSLAGFGVRLYARCRWTRKHCIRFGYSSSVGTRMLTRFESNSLTACEIAADPIEAPGWVLAPPKAPGGMSWTAKTIVERVIALVALVGLAPLLAMIAAMIVVESGRPVLFRQPRFGRNGIPFDVLKFRTMWTELCDSTGAGQTGDADPRVTRVGLFLRRTSLDELPQLWNVLVGQMALVGPRAHPCGMQVQGRLCEDLLPTYHDRHKVLPGITGWAQVNGSRGAVKTAEMLQRRVALDLEYIRDWSLWLDLKILWRTVWVVLSGKLAR